MAKPPVMKMSTKRQKVTETISRSARDLTKMNNTRYRYSLPFELTKYLCLRFISSFYCFLPQSHFCRSFSRPAHNLLASREPAWASKMPFLPVSPDKMTLRNRLRVYNPRGVREVAVPDF